MLLAASELAGDDLKADRKAVVRLCEGTVIDGRMPDHEASIKYAVQIGLLQATFKRLTITKVGIDFLEMNPERLYDLSEDQRRFLIRTCYLHGPFREMCLKALSSFSPSYAKGTYRWSAVDGPPIDGGENVLEQLRELGLLTRGDGWYEVNAKFVDTVANFLAEGKGFTEKQFFEYLREKQEVGGIAEALALRWENERLRKSGNRAEAASIRPVSKLKVNAGYDIESFDGKSRGVNYDRFIEVKGSRSPKLRFLWTENEMKIARKLGNKYWIYFQGGIDVAAKSAENEMLLFQDPVQSILKDAKFTKTPQGIVVEADIKGRILVLA